MVSLLFGLLQLKSSLQHCLNIEWFPRCYNELFAGMYSDALKDKAGELWETILRLETEKYDLQERQKRQDYDVSRVA